MAACLDSLDLTHMGRSRTLIMDRSMPLSSWIWKHLCNDVIVQILSWLPVDSLLRFKTVSNSWLSLITNPKFAKLHLYHYHSLATTIHNPTILFTTNKSYTMKSIDELVAASSSSIIEKHEMINSFDFSQQVVVVVGSCNGLICLHAYNRCCYTEPDTDTNNILCLWNPSTKEFKQLPFGEGINEYPRKYIFKCIRYGFGYDHVIDDYKVIATKLYFVEEDMNYLDDHCCFRELEVVMVYTLGTNSWRRVQFNKPYKFESSQSVYINTRTIVNWTYVNGGFHHIAPSSIISFDIVDEVYRGVPIPECVESNSSSMHLWDLTVLRGCLCVSVHAESSTDKDKYMQVWMMVDYGVKESWTKLFNITNNVVDIFRFKPTWLHKNGEVMVGNSMFVIYNDDPKHNQVKRLKPRSSNDYRDGCFWFETEIYTGSLVSLKSHCE